jgi:hypothetical protein
LEAAMSQAFFDQIDLISALSAHSVTWAGRLTLGVRFSAIFGPKQGLGGSFPPLIFLPIQRGMKKKDPP